MTISEFKELKRQIEKILQKMEQEALEQGIVIASQDFQDFLQQAKEELLKRRGVSLEEFESFEGEHKTKKRDEYKSLIKDWFDVPNVKGDTGPEGKQGLQGKQGLPGVPGKTTFTPEEERKIWEHIAAKHFTKQEAESLISKALMKHERYMEKEIAKNIQEVEKKIQVLQERNGEIPRIVVSSTEPLSPQTGDLWVEA